MSLSRPVSFRPALMVVWGLLLVLGALSVVALPAPAEAALRCTIKGTAKKDTLVGTKRADVICGLGGADVLVGRGGNDTLVGGGGDDALDGSGGADQLSGDDGADSLVGGAGADRLAGGPGADLLDGSTGPDAMSGGGGVDTATYALRTTAVKVALDGRKVSGVPGEGDSVATDVERATGGAGDDVLVGNGSANRLAGGSGADQLSGMGGADELVGDEGYAGPAIRAARTARSARTEPPEVEDVLDGGSGDDLMVGGAGPDELLGGTGSDTVSYADADGPVVADLDGKFGDGTAGEQDTIGEDVESLTGTGFDDQLTGDEDANTLDGGAGTDELVGAAGADVLDAGTGTDELTDGGLGGDECLADDELIEDVPNCEPGDGFGVYGRVTMDPPPAADLHPGHHNASKVPLAAASLSTGESIVMVTSDSGDPSITKLDEHGGIDPTFGTDGWVWGLPAIVGDPWAYPGTLQVFEDDIYVHLMGTDHWIAKLDSDGVLQTSFGGDGFIGLKDAPSVCASWCTAYPFRSTDGELALGYHHFEYHPETETATWLVGSLRFSPEDGSVQQVNTFEDGVVDGDLPQDVLPMSDGSALTISRAGNVRSYLPDGSRDATFAGDGLLEPDAELVGEGRNVLRPLLAQAQDGFARLGLAGTARAADGTGVPKIVATDPQSALVEHFDASGEPVSAYGDSWTKTSIDLPPEPEPCDPSNDGYQSFSTEGMDPVLSKSLLAIRRCSDAIWVGLEPEGGGTVVRRTGPNQPRDTDAVAVAGGTLLVYASARDLVSAELVPGDLVDVAVVPRKPSVTVKERSSTVQGVRLTGEPAGPVTVSVASEDTGVATVSPSTLTFTPENWSTPQGVTVTSVGDDDLLDDGTTVTLTSSRPEVASRSFGVVVDDTDVQTIETSVSSVDVAEGEAANVTVRLGRKPGDNVTVQVATSDTGVATASKQSLTFTPETWDVPQVVGVHGVSDADAEDDVASLALSAVGIPTTELPIHVADDDVVAVVADPTNFSVLEGTAKTFTVRLAAQPEATLTLSLQPSASGVVSVSPSTLELTSQNWDDPQVVTVTALQDDDALVDLVEVTMTSERGFEEDVSVTVVDDDA